MAIQKTEKIWHNRKLICWDDAQIHVMSHVVNYGSSVFEGIRCYALPTGPAIFRAQEHTQRLLDSAKVYRIDVDYTREAWTTVTFTLEPSGAGTKLSVSETGFNEVSLARRAKVFKDNDQGWAEVIVWIQQYAEAKG